MEAYKERMKKELKELEEKVNKLSVIITGYYNGSLDFELSCPIYLLERQLATMREYLKILYARAQIEGIKL